MTETTATREDLLKHIAFLQQCCEKSEAKAEALEKRVDELEKFSGGVLLENDQLQNELYEAKAARQQFERVVSDQSMLDGQIEEYAKKDREAKDVIENLRAVAASTAAEVEQLRNGNRNVARVNQFLTANIRLYQRILNQNGIADILTTTTHGHTTSPAITPNGILKGEELIGSCAEGARQLSTPNRDGIRSSSTSNGYGSQLPTPTPWPAPSQSLLLQKLLTSVSMTTASLNQFRGAYGYHQLDIIDLENSPTPSNHSDHSDVGVQADISERKRQHDFCPDCEDSRLEKESLSKQLEEKTLELSALKKKYAKELEAQMGQFKHQTKETKKLVERMTKLKDEKERLEKKLLKARQRAVSISSVETGEIVSPTNGTTSSSEPDQDSNVDHRGSASSGGEETTSTGAKAETAALMKRLMVIFAEQGNSHSSKKKRRTD